ncbi:MAG: ADP-forming succinate--CoA ligase subunit beta [Chloroflexi bacterium]|nr:ADP-forming succinate--CoA ligase subunit beta [Chloroflexota bacterium]
MKLHEYQAKELLARYGVPVPKGRVARTPEEAEQVAAELGGKAVVKAQVHAGGRGKAGGIKLAATPVEARAAAQALLGTRLVTHQSGPAGQPIDAVLVEEQTDIARELYLAVIIDSARGMPVVIASAAGGMEIEEVAEAHPERIFSEPIDPTVGFQPFQARALAFATGLDGDLNRPAVAAITNLVGAALECDGSLAEINPLAVTADNRIVALDAKFNVDDNADYRQQALFGLADTAQDEPIEVRARDAGIENYVKLGGNIGCMVNGAGLAMATMDAIQFEGGMPANFLDIGTQNDPAAIKAALEIIGADPDVRAVLVNIFGGLARTDVIAEGVVLAKREGLIPQPTVVRLAGTNVEAGMKILDDSGLDLLRADGFAEAARMAVAAVR